MIFLREAVRKLIPVANNSSSCYTKLPLLATTNSSRSHPPSSPVCRSSSTVSTPSSPSSPVYRSSSTASTPSSSPPPPVCHFSSTTSTPSSSPPPPVCHFSSTTSTPSSSPPPPVCRSSSTASTPPWQWTLCPLPHRCLVSVSGKEAASFLQGLMTNDINILVEGERPSLYCMFLNVRGRIIFDSLLSRGFTHDQFLVEVDSSIAPTVVKHLMMYRVRRKVKVEMMKDTTSLYVAFIDNSTQDHDPEKMSQNPLLGSTYCGYHGEPSLPSQALASGPDDSVLMFPDGRLPSLGHRLVVPANCPDPLSHLPSQSKLGSSSLYLEHRYKLGVAEGTGDIPPDQCFPVEYNADYLNGVNFHKGCYIGQELTARTHHTGVVRKRILPIEILEEDEREINVDSPIKNEKGKTVGKVRNVEGRRGIGLMRLAESQAAQSLSVEGVKLGTTRPSWWPMDSKLK